MANQANEQINASRSALITSAYGTLAVRKAGIISQLSVRQHLSLQYRGDLIRHNLIIIAPASPAPAA